MNKRLLARLALPARLGLLALLGLPVQALAQPPQPPPPPQPDVQQTHLPGDSVQAASPVAGVPTRISFDEAVKRAVAQNPSVLVAAANILSAQGLLRQARAAVLPNVAVTGTNVTLDDSRGVGDQVFTPQNTFSAGIGVAMPLFAPAQWAERVQALDAQHVAEAGTDEVKRQIAVATAQAYLSVIAARRVVESQVRARDTAYAFYEYADNRLKAGAGSKLTALQAQLTVSADEALVEIARLALYRSQEALGVLVTEDVPVDAQDEPVFEIPEETATLSTVDQTVQQRTDIKLANLQVFAAQRIVSDSWKDWLPSVTGLFQPLFQDPGSDVIAAFELARRPGVRYPRVRRRHAPRREGDPAGVAAAEPGGAERTGARGEIRGAPLLRVGAPQRARAPELACRVAAGLAGPRHHHVQLPGRRGDEPRRHRRPAPLARRGYGSCRC